MSIDEFADHLKKLETEVSNLTHSMSYYKEGVNTKLKELEDRMDDVEQRLTSLE